MVVLSFRVGNHTNYQYDSEAGVSESTRVMIWCCLLRASCVGLGPRIVTGACCILRTECSWRTLYDGLPESILIQGLRKATSKCRGRRSRGRRWKVLSIILTCTITVVPSVQG